MTEKEKIYADAYHKGVGDGAEKMLCEVIDLVYSDDFWLKIRISEFPHTTMIEEIGKLRGAI